MALEFAHKKTSILFIKTHRTLFFKKCAHSLGLLSNIIFYLNKKKQPTTKNDDDDDHVSLEAVGILLKRRALYKSLTFYLFIKDEVAVEWAYCVCVSPFFSICSSGTSFLNVCKKTHRK